MTSIGPVSGKTASFGKGAGAPLGRRMWWIPAIRGALAVWTFGASGFHAIRVMESALARGAMVASAGERRDMSQRAKFEETLRRLAMIDEGFVEDEVGLGIDPAATSALDPKTTAMLQVGASVAIGSPAVRLEWSTGQGR
jgi:hypothetical protein